MCEGRGCWGRTEGREEPVILSAEKGPGEVCEFVAVAGKELSCPAWGAGEAVSQSRTRALPVGTAW